MRWRSPGGIAAPRRVLVVDDALKADSAYRLACEGTALLWRGDFQNARQLLQALAGVLAGKRAAKAPCPKPFTASAWSRRSGRAFLAGC